MTMVMYIKKILNGKNVIPVIRLLNKNGYLVIVSNQSGVGRGFTC